LAINGDIQMSRDMSYDKRYELASRTQIHISLGNGGELVIMWIVFWDMIIENGRLRNRSKCDGTRT